MGDHQGRPSAVNLDPFVVYGNAYLHVTDRPCITAVNVKRINPNSLTYTIHTFSSSRVSAHSHVRLVENVNLNSSICRRQRSLQRNLSSRLRLALPHTHRYLVVCPHVSWYDELRPQRHIGDQLVALSPRQEHFGDNFARRVYEQYIHDSGERSINDDLSLSERN